jgi:hypothetical protein
MTIPCPAWLMTNRLFANTVLCGTYFERIEPRLSDAQHLLSVIHKRICVVVEYLALIQEK